MKYEYSMSNMKTRALATSVMVVEGNIENGAKLFKARCAHCHSIEKVLSIV